MSLLTKSKDDISDLPTPISRNPLRRWTRRSTVTYHQHQHLSHNLCLSCSQYNTIFVATTADVDVAPTILQSLTCVIGGEHDTVAAELVDHIVVSFVVTGAVGFPRTVQTRVNRRLRVVKIFMLRLFAYFWCDESKSITKLLEYMVQMGRFLESHASRCPSMELRNQRGADVVGKVLVVPSSPRDLLMPRCGWLDTTSAPYLPCWRTKLAAHRMQKARMGGCNSRLAIMFLQRKGSVQDRLCIDDIDIILLLQVSPLFAGPILMHPIADKLSEGLSVKSRAGFLDSAIFTQEP